MRDHAYLHVINSLPLTFQCSMHKLHGIPTITRHLLIGRCVTGASGN